jgi:hypothetical protein
MKGRRLLLVLAMALVPACDKQSNAPIVGPPTPPTPPPDRVAAEFPAPRSTGVPYDSPIWVEFSVPVDTATISERTVFFKADTQRLPASRTWDPATRRLRIIPDARLGLRKTYTIELAGTIRFSDGTTLGETHSWQFTTNSLRRPESPLPMDGGSEQSPFVALQWGGLTESSAGPITYEVYAGPDSAAARDPLPPAVASLTPAGGAVVVPRNRWRQDGVTYWAVHALNGLTGERLIGPVWSFNALPADAPYDSIAVAAIDWDWLESNNTGRQHCTEDSLVMGVRANIISSIRWSMGLPDTTVRLAGVAIDLTPRYGSVAAVPGPSVWYATFAFPGCSHGVPATGPPVTDETDAKGKLADAVVLSPTRIRFASDALAAHVEATRRLGGLYGYLFRADRRRSYFGPGAGNPNVKATMWLYVYRTPPGPVPPRLAAGRRAR